MNIFGDGFDLYTTTADFGGGYWDAVTGGAFTVGAAGRFPNSFSISNLTSTGTWLSKSNTATADAVHHLSFGFLKTLANSGTNQHLYLQLLDGVTPQVSIVFRSDGTFQLTSGAPTGTQLALSPAIVPQSSWNQYEMEVVISPGSGSFSIRKNGSLTNDYTATGLNTRSGANNNANKLIVGQQTQPNLNGSFSLDDLLWRSDQANVPWLGDVRCVARRPATDVRKQFIGVPTTVTAYNNVSSTYRDGPVANQIWFMPLTIPANGQVTALQAMFVSAVTGNVNMALYDNTGPMGPGNLLTTATPINNPTTGLLSFVLASPFAVTKGAAVWVAMLADVTLASTIAGYNIAATSPAINFAYANGFPPNGNAAFVGPGRNGFTYLGVAMATNNAACVSELQQDGTGSYVFDATIGDNDLYTVASLATCGATQPSAISHCVTRGFMQKSDAGARNGAMQLTSGSITVQTPAASLATGFNWSWRLDQTDPNTGANWTAAAADAAQLGPIVLS